MSDDGRMSISIVLFDLDDTLTDVATFGPSVLVAAAARHGRHLSIEEIQASPGARYEPLAARLLHLEPPEAAAIYATYVELYRQMMADGLRAHCGALELLRALADREVKVGLVTNKLEALAREIVECLGWTALIGVIVGHDSSPFRKPDPAVVRYAIEILGGTSETTAFVGDSVDDMTAAAGAEVAMIVGMLVTTPGERLVEAGAMCLCSDLAEVLAIVNT